jgi:hypothetical protein
MTPFLSTFQRYAVLALCYLVVLTASRLLLIGIFDDRVSQTDGFGFILLQGFRFDIILLGLGPIALVKPWLHTHAVLRRVKKWILPIYVGVVTALAFFVEASSASFLAEFDSRPNYIFVEYLLYPSEVLPTVFSERPIELVAFSMITILNQRRHARANRALQDPGRDSRRDH